MSAWISEGEALQLLSAICPVTAHALKDWQWGHNKAAKKLLDGDLKTRVGARGAREYWRADVELIARTARPLAPFTEKVNVTENGKAVEREQTWLPSPDVKARYRKWYRLLEKWARRKCCRHLPHNRVPVSRQEFVLASGNTGLKEVRFWLEEDLKAINVSIAAQDNGHGDLITVEEAAGILGSSVALVFGLLKAGKLHGHQDNRPDSLGRPQPRTLLSRAQVQEALQAYTPPAHPGLVLPSEAAEEYGYPVGTMKYHETHKGAYLSKPLERVYEKALVPYKPRNRKPSGKGRKGKQGGNACRAVRKMKHYRREQLGEWYRNEHGAMPGVRLDDKGNRWMTVGAARREDEKYQQTALEYLHAVGLLDAQRFSRVGSGRDPNPWHYLADGERGFVTLFAQGKVPPLGDIIVARVARALPGRKPANTPTAEAHKPAANGQASANERPDPSPRKTGGRPPSKVTWAVYEFTYNLYVRDGEKAPLVMRKVNEHFKRTAIREEKHVWLFAKRFADKHGLPMKNRER
jgi:hypothetical protein